MTVKDLTYYNEHPDELPDDADSLQELMDQLESVPIESEPEQQEEEQVVVDDKEVITDEEQTDVETVEVDTSDDEPELMAKDGKNRIPYAVLEKTRRDLNDRDQELKDAQEELEKLRAQGATDSETPSDEPVESDDGMSELLEDYGDTPLAAVAQKQQEKIDKLQHDIQTLSDERAKTEEKLNQEQVDTAIDANPTLSRWREKGGSLWNLAIMKDQELQNDPDWNTASLEERFNEVSRSISEDLGVPFTNSEPETVNKVKVDTSSTPTPKSLSDIPAGDPPKQTTTEEVKNMSPSAIGHKFSNMSSDQQEAYLASLDG